MKRTNGRYMHTNHANLDIYSHMKSWCTRTFLQDQTIKQRNLYIAPRQMQHQNLTSLTFFFITSQARRERNPPATDSNCTIRVATARGRLPQYAEMLSGSYTKGKNSLLSSTWRSMNRIKHPLQNTFLKEEESHSNYNLCHSCFTYIKHQESRKFT